MRIDGPFRRSLVARILRIASATAALAPLAGTSGCSGAEPEHDTVCLTWHEDLGPCMDRAQALDDLNTEIAGQPCNEYYRDYLSVDSDPELRGGACCYEVTPADPITCAEAGRL